MWFLCPFQGIFITPRGPGIVSVSTGTLIRIKHLLKLNERLNERLNEWILWTLSECVVKAGYLLRLYSRKNPLHFFLVREVACPKKKKKVREKCTGKHRQCGVCNLKSNHRAVKELVWNMWPKTKPPQSEQIYTRVWDSLRKHWETQLYCTRGLEEVLVLRSATHTDHHAGSGNQNNTSVINKLKIHSVRNNSEEDKLISKGNSTWSKMKKKKGLLFSLILQANILSLISTIWADMKYLEKKKGQSWMFER